MFECRACGLLKEAYTSEIAYLRSQLDRQVAAAAVERLEYKRAVAAHIAALGGQGGLVGATSFSRSTDSDPNAILKAFEAHMGALDEVEEGTV